MSVEARHRAALPGTRMGRGDGQRPDTRKEGGTPAHRGGEAADGALALGGGEEVGGAPTHRGGVEEEARRWGQAGRRWSKAESSARGPDELRNVSVAWEDRAERGFVM
jgi:hypothetical protein